jgi:hypothetical protein
MNKANQSKFSKITLIDLNINLFHPAYISNLAAAGEETNDRAWTEVGLDVIVSISRIKIRLSL